MRGFNVSYSSLGTVRTFPFDKITFDRSPTLEINQDHQAAVIVRTVLTFGRIQSIAMLAEPWTLQTNSKSSSGKAETQFRAFSLESPEPIDPEEIRRARGPYVQRA